MLMNKNQLNKLRKVKKEHCITVILNTHRTHPESLQDAIVLKNLVMEASGRLMEMQDKKTARMLTEKLEHLAGTVDHNYNMESLILFVNEDIAEMVRLPVEVTNRVIIDDTFAVRDLIRAVNMNTHYFILVLSKDGARLIEAMNDKEIREWGDPFPIENEAYSKMLSPEAKAADREKDLIAEFFNFVDKRVNEVIKERNIPVLICSDEENYYKYLKVADRKDTIIPDFLSRSRQQDKAQTIVSDAWQLMKDYTAQKNETRKSELLQAVNDNKFLSDTSEIRNAISMGRVQTLFIENGLYQPAAIEDNAVVYKEETGNDPGSVDDIYDDLIQMNLEFGGDVVFLPPGELRKFNGFGAVTRY